MILHCTELLSTEMSHTTAKLQLKAEGCPHPTVVIGCYISQQWSSLINKKRNEQE
jgi:hypothetical protein